VMQQAATPRERPSGEGARPLRPKIPHLFYGGDYNPEQWPEDVWQEDMLAMREAGVNLVSVGIFSWARLEPRPGEYDFAWLDRVLDLLHANGIAVNLATATASPPPWLANLHPESLPETVDGLRLWPGARQHYCPSSRAYREAAANLVRQIATRYKDHPTLAMWHINNEYGCHVSTCYCDASAEAFRDWLRQRYCSLDTLNEAWGTNFWSQRYGDWDEILPPRRAPNFCNPTQQLDFRRFSSDALLELFDMERDILKEVTPELPVTTNFMGFFKPLDYWEWARHEDMISNDSYPDPADASAPMFAAMADDLMRSLGEGKPWMVMEQTPSRVNWRAHNALKRPGQMRLWSMQAIARGADGVLMFQWRAAKAGAEKFHGAFVGHGGTAHSRIWNEVVNLGQELRQLDEILGARTPAEVAIVVDWHNWWALELDSKPSASVTMLDAIQRYYRPLYAYNIAVDFVPPGTDLSAYKLVLVPNLYLVRSDAAEHLERHVERGGVLIMSFFSGIADERDHILLGGYPAPFRQLLGLRVEDFDVMAPGQSNEISVADLSDQETFGCNLWADLIELEGAETVASFEREFYAGGPAVTRHTFGLGTAYYVGTRPDESFMEWLIARACDGAGVTRPSETQPNVEVVQRVGDTANYLFILNHNAHEITHTLSAPAFDILSQTDCGGEIVIGPYGVGLLRQQVKVAL
jgi:beta-galactosidase